MNKNQNTSTMFKGYINDKEYTDQTEYYKDLNEIQSRGGNFTANCTFTSDNVKQEELPFKEKDSDLDAVIDRLEDLDSLYKDYMMSEDKKKWLETCKNHTPFVASKGLMRMIHELDHDEFIELDNILSRKIKDATLERTHYNKEIEEIKKLYETLDKERTELYDRLKELNEKCNGCTEALDDCNNIMIILNYLDSLYKEYRNVMNEKNEPAKEVQGKVKEEAKTGETFAMDALIDSFRKLYEHLLN